MSTSPAPRPRPPADRARERGAAALEFALVLPLLVMLVFGVITFGRAYQAKVELSSGVREGARLLALGKSSGEAKTATIDAAPGLNPALSAGDITTSACPSGGADGTARVRATYSLQYTIPLVSSGTLTLHADGAMRCGV
jgi:Flp pilus assembly protein TadG